MKLTVIFHYSIYDEDFYDVVGFSTVHTEDGVEIYRSEVNDARNRTNPLVFVDGFTKAMKMINDVDVTFITKNVADDTIDR